MKAAQRASARKQIDKRLNALRNADGLSTPPRGWIKAIREALGMTSTQLGRRLGVRQPTVLGYEKAEASKSITLESLERAASALDCRLVYVLVPRQSLESLVEERAREVAGKRMQSVSHSMALEGQRVEARDEREQLDQLASELIDQPGSALWDDE